MGSVRGYAAVSTLAGIFAMLSLTLPIILIKGKNMLEGGEKIAYQLMSSNAHAMH